MEVTFFAATLFAALASTAFALRYGLGVRWEESAEGRSMLAGAAATAMLAWTYAANRLDEMLPHEDWRRITIPLRILAWLVITIVYLWKGCLLCAHQTRRWGAR